MLTCRVKRTSLRARAGPDAHASPASRIRGGHGVVRVHGACGRRRSRRGASYGSATRCRAPTNLILSRSRVMGGIPLGEDSARSGGMGTEGREATGAVIFLLTFGMIVLV